MFFMVTGTHASGKSMMMGLIASSLGIEINTEKVNRKKLNYHFNKDKNYVLVGKYGLREGANGYPAAYTGGLDSSGKQDERRQLLYDVWDKDLIMGESHMICYVTMWKTMKTLHQEKKAHKIFIMHLDVPDDHLISRWEARSKGKKMTPDRMKHLEAKQKDPPRLKKYMENDPHYKKLLIHKTVRNLTLEDSINAAAMAIKTIKENI